jgi:hypothetical protein
VFDDNGNPINTIDTGFSVLPYRNGFLNNVTIALTGENTALLSTYDNTAGEVVLGTVTY